MSAPARLDEMAHLDVCVFFHMFLRIRAGALSVSHSGAQTPLAGQDSTLYWHASRYAGLVAGKYTCSYSFFMYAVAAIIREATLGEA